MSNKDGIDQYPDVFVTGDSLDRSLLNRTVPRFIKIYIDGDTTEVVFTPDGSKLTARQKLLVYLLARKILKDTGRIEDEAITPSELEKTTGIAGGTIRPTLAKLADARLVVKDKSDGGGYYVPNYSVEKASHEIVGDE